MDPVTRLNAKVARRVGRLVSRPRSCRSAHAAAVRRAGADRRHSGRVLRSLRASNHAKAGI